MSPVQNFPCVCSPIKETGIYGLKSQTMASDADAVEDVMITYSFWIPGLAPIVDSSCFCPLLVKEKFVLK